MMLSLTDTDGALVATTDDGLELFHYVYLDRTEQLQSPRPYLHPVRTLAGDVVTIYRPTDHLWHRGFSLALPNVGAHNFWGGVTYTREQGYVQLPNNGATVHDGFSSLTGGDGGGDGSVAIAESLGWITQDGERLVDEDRTITARLIDDASWTFSVGMTWHNRSGAGIVFGSPGTEGRTMAGYGGFFWRGPREFDRGHVLAPADLEVTPELTDSLAALAEKPDVPAAMGRSGRWLGYVGKHDGTWNTSSILIVDSPSNPGSPTPWFAREQPYGCVSASPFFFTETTLPAGESWTWRYDVVIHAGELDVDAAEMLVAGVGVPA
jgi:hypothetical protein